MNAIEAINLTKRFPGVLANDHINLAVKKGTVHAIVGENGAGKSTLMNTLYGLYIPDEGEIKVNDKVVKLKTAKDAIANGIGMVHQHFMLIPTMTVAENIVLGNETGSKFKFDRKKAIEAVEELSKKYNLAIDPREYVSNTSVGMQQRIEILKALYRGIDILILDEPTAVLTPQEVRELFESIRYLISQGKTIIIITHKLDEVLEISDEISVLRHGKKVGTVKTSDVDEMELTRMMVGRDVQLGGAARKEIHDKETVLKIENLSYTDDKGVKVLDNINLDVKRGEILGIAGVDGNGQQEIINLISGLLTGYEGKIEICGVSIDNKSIRQIKEIGLGFIPEDRHKHGLVLEYSVADNLVKGIHGKNPFAKSGFLNFKKIEQNAEQKMKDFDIRAANIHVPAGTLSGGNQQKIIIAREMSKNPELVVAMQPTRGLDIGAIEFVHNILVEARNNGKCVLLVSLELEEILHLSDRIAVINSGKIVGTLDIKEANRDKLGLMMLGLEDKIEEANCEA